MFDKRDQQGESFDTYLNLFRSLAKPCYFGELRDNLLRDRIVLGLLDNATRKKLLVEHKLTLDKCVNICRANETTTKQFKEITSNEISAVTTSRRPQRCNTGSSLRNHVTRNNKGCSPGQRDLDHSQIKCKFCLKTHTRKKELCAAWQKHCQDCGVLNHFLGSSVCTKPATKKSVHGVDELSDDSDDDYFLYVESVSAINAEECQ